MNGAHTMRISRSLGALGLCALFALSFTGCTRYSTTRQVLPSCLTYMDPTGKKDAKYVRTVRKTLLGLNLFGFVATDIDANEAIRRDVENNRNFRVANLQVTHGCFNDYGAVLTWFFTVPICKLQYDILEVTQ